MHILSRIRLRRRKSQLIWIILKERSVGSYSCHGLLLVIIYFLLGSVPVFLPQLVDPIQSLNLLFISLINLAELATLPRLYHVHLIQHISRFILSKRIVRYAIPEPFDIICQILFNTILSTKELHFLLENAARIMIKLTYVLFDDFLHGISFVISKWLFSEHRTDKINMVLLLFHLVWTFILRPFPEIERVLALQSHDRLGSCMLECLLHRCCRLIGILWLVGSLWV